MDINDYAIEYRLNVRQGVTWKEGTPLTTEDVAFNITQWSDSTAEGNLIPGRFAAFVDEATGGGFQIVGNHVCYWYARDSG